MPISSRRTATIATCVVVLVSLCCGGLNKEELACEEAVAHLEECCPGFQSSRVRCIDEDRGCVSQRPDITVEMSRCIRSEECGALVTYGICARAKSYREPGYAGLSCP